MVDCRARPGIRHLWPAMIEPGLELNMRPPNCHTVPSCCSGERQGNDEPTCETTEKSESGRVGVGAASNVVRTRLRHRQRDWSVKLASTWLYRHHCSHCNSTSELARRLLTRYSLNLQHATIVILTSLVEICSFAWDRCQHNIT